MNIVSVEHPPTGSLVTIRFTFDEFAHTVACLGGLSDNEIKIELISHQGLSPDDAERIVAAGSVLYYNLFPLIEKNT